MHWVAALCLCVVCWHMNITIGVVAFVAAKALAFLA